MVNRRIIFVVLAISLLSGCASWNNNTGQSDYRIAESVPPPSAKVLAERELCSTRLLNEPCRGYTPVEIFRKYTPGSTSFSPGDVYSIDVLQGNMGNYISESILTRRFGETAEVLILANVFEEAADEKAALEVGLVSQAALTENQLQNETKLKVIWFGEDVYAGQSFNFSNLRLTPLTVWGGRKIYVQIVVIEVDSSSEPVNAMLETLAGFGKDSNNGLTGGSVEQVLLSLGKSLFDAQSQDDIIAQFDFTLDPQVGELSQYQPTFQPGIMVFRRTHQRTQEMEWEKLRFDHETGRLFHARNEGSGGNGGGAAQEFREDLYLTLNIQKYPPGTKPTFYNFPTYADLMKQVDAAVEERSQPFEQAVTELSGMFAAARSERTLSDLQALWGNANIQLEASAISQVVLQSDQNCEYIDEPGLSEIRARFKNSADLALANFKAAYNLAREPKSSGNGQQGSGDNASTTKLNDSDGQAQIDSVASYHLNSPQFAAANYVTPDAFKKFLERTSGDTFESTSKSAALAQHRYKNCNTLIALGLAKEK